MKKASLQIFTAILVLGLFCGTAAAAPSIIAASPGDNATVNKTVGEIQDFSIQTNESATIDWQIDGSNVSETSYDSATNTSTLNHTVTQGTYDVKAIVQSTGGSRTWSVTGGSDVPQITSFFPSYTTVNNNVGQSRKFNATISQTSNMTWYVDDVQVQENNSVTDSSYINTSATQGMHTIKMSAENENGSVEKSWKWKISTVGGLSVNVDPSEGTVSVDKGASKTFQVNSSTDDQDINVEWLVDSESKKKDESVTSSSYDFEEDSAGNYTLKAVVSDPNGTYDDSTKTWTVSVGSSTDNSTGNRIWEKGMPTTYTWTAQSYSGFYYDLDSGVSSEEMTITDIGSSIKSGNIEYSTKPTETDFEYSKWGSYQIIGFMAEKYFAGYTENNSTVIGDDISPISDGVLSKILIDTDDKKSANAGDSLVLEEGYSLNIVEVDVNGESVWVQLEKDGDVVDEAFLKSGDDYVYETDLGDSEDVPIIIAHIGTVFEGAETSAVFIQGLFQISDDYVEVENGDTFGEMEVTSVSSSEIKMENDDSVGFDKGDTVDLMGKIQIQVADDDTLRFAPILDTSEAGTYELRGTVYDEDIDGDSLPSWTPFNFEGFYYNIDEGIGTENLTVEELDGRNIPADNLVYKSTPQAVDFDHDEWGNFTVIGFMADKYFAGYTDGSVEGAVDDVSLLSDNILCKVLTDSDDKRSMDSGSALTLEEGYSLNIKEVDVNGESVWVQLEKDGDVVDEAFLSSGDDYVYETDLGDAENVPLIIVHFGTVFQGSETSAVFVQGIFQLSDQYTEINNGDTFGDMEVTSVSESGIIMKNDDSIGLGKDETSEIMGNVSFKTANDDTLRFYPFVEVETGGNGSDNNSLKISVPDKIYAGNSFDIEVTAGNESIKGANVSVNESSVGETDGDGVVEYTAKDVGTLKITAEKDDYKTANKNINVSAPKEEMTVNVSPETVYVGDTLNIEAVKSIGGDPIDGANVSIDGKIIGQTDSSGKATYKTDKRGTLELGLTKEGFEDQEINVKVKDLEANYTYSNLVIDPLEVSAGKDTTISVSVENTGNAAGNESVELLINGNISDSKDVSLGIGNNTTVTFEHAEEVPGTYKVEIGGENSTYTVKEKSSLMLYILGFIVLLIIGGAAYYFTKGGGDMSKLSEQVKELINSVKPKK
ncbi:S-layer protein domain-containing protein [Methanosarcina vacuolata]|uniref:S-layer family duplication domain protein n=1 Tax=Methanosarcina vacuolata Z-761 TaxID=1434123 RepID=A0A0E3QA69_9EURY|nr:S-layer protein domain-containing protein [Methanosarcina vacuolata]AKB45735.1 S-layer family duplication domain protein [Methanosarcina vacuolata Z-761]